MCVVHASEPGNPARAAYPATRGNARIPRLSMTPSTATEPAAAAIHAPEAPRTTTPQAACAPNPTPTDPMSDLPSLSHVLGTRVTTLSQVPKGARDDSWSRALSNALSSICDEPNDITRWSKLFMLAKCVLFNPRAAHRLPWRDILRQVKARLRRWASGDWAELWAEAVSEGHPKPKRAGSSTKPQHYHNIRQARSAVHDGQYTKAIQALTSEGLASPSNEVLNEMISKHPQVPPATLPTGPAPTPPTISESAVKKV